MLDLIKTELSFADLSRVNPVAFVKSDPKCPLYKYSGSVGERLFVLSPNGHVPNELLETRLPGDPHRGTEGLVSGDNREDVE